MSTANSVSTLSSKLSSIPDAKPLRAAAYVRVSTGRQVKHDLSMPDQIEQIVQYCRSRGWELHQVYEEPGESGTDENRVVFRQMLEDALDKKHPYDVILVHSLSRFARDHIVLGQCARNLKKRKVRLQSITQEMPEDTAGELLMTIIAVLDEHSSKENAKHVSRAMKKNAVDGFWNGSPPPLGYTTEVAEVRGDRAKKRLVIDPATAPLVKEIFELFLEGDGKSGPLGLKGIAAYLNERGTRTHRGGLFTIKSVYDILTRETYAGVYRFNQRDSRSGERRSEDEVVTAQVPAIIDRADWDRVQTVLAARSPCKTPPKIVSCPTLLTGLVRCARCGMGMTINTGKSGKYKYYACNAHHRMGKAACVGQRIAMPKLDSLVVGKLVERLMTPERLEEIFGDLATSVRAKLKDRSKDRATVRAELREVEARTGKLLEAVEKGVLDLADPSLRDRFASLRLKRDTLQAELRKMENETPQLPPRVGKAQLERFCERMRARLQDGDIVFKQTLLRAIADRIEVGGGAVKIMGSMEKLHRAVSAGPFSDRDDVVPRFMEEWRARRDSNSRPSGSKPDALSN